jgi:hypothetical protein
MKKFIPTPFKLLFRKLYIGEHFFIYFNSLIAPLTVLINGLPMLTAMFNALKTVFGKEDELFKHSQMAFQTKEIHDLHDKQIVCVNFFWDAVEFFRHQKNTALEAAIAKLDYLHHTYVDLTNSTYLDMGGMVINFLQDCSKPEYQSAIQTLSATQFVNLTAVLGVLQTASDDFNALYEERTLDKEQAAALGRLSEIRFDVDDVLDSFIDAANVAWTDNELGAKNPDTRQKLTEVKQVVTGAIHQAQLTLARRGRHRMPSGGGSGTQTPDASNPAAPDTPPQTPDATPPAINPDELNPPAVGER